MRNIIVAQHQDKPLKREVERYFTISEQKYYTCSNSTSQKRLQIFFLQTYWPTLK